MRSRGPSGPASAKPTTPRANIPLVNLRAVAVPSRTPAKAAEASREKQAPTDEQQRVRGERRHRGNQINEGRSRFGEKHWSQ